MKGELVSKPRELLKGAQGRLRRLRSPFPIAQLEHLKVCSTSYNVPIGGLWRRPVAHSFGVGEVGGSNPLSPTNHPNLGQSFPAVRN
jgi:hypothetical protein